MNSRLITSLLELGDATSRNLEFSQGDDIFVSYGEETITETNLLELRRRHPVQIELETFSKRREARIGADWEWRIIGRHLTLKMRVQAKRVQRDCVLRIKHTVKSSGSQQRDLLIRRARLDSMKPVYCVYCSEPQRAFWTQAPSPHGFEPYQTGCLLAAAQDVPAATRRLRDIEHNCIPWHFLFDPSTYLHAEATAHFPDPEDHRLAFVLSASASGPVLLDEPDSESAPASRWNPPTIDDLNQDTGRDFDPIGVAPTIPEDRERLSAGTDARRRSRREDRERLHDSGIHFSLVMDVQDDIRFSRPDPAPSR